MAVERDTLIRQVDEELRREQLQKLWEQYGIYAIAAAVLLVAGVGGFKWWEARQIAAAEAAGARYEAAASLAQSGKADAALKAFETIASEGPAGYAALARLRLAGSAAKAGNTAAAVAMHDVLAGDTNVDPLIRDFARLQAAALKLDSADWTEMQNRLNALLGDNNPWRYSARELFGLAAVRAGKLDEARQALGPLASDPRVPASIRERAGSIMGLVVATELAKLAPPAPEPDKSEAPKAEPPKAPPAKGAAAKGGASRK